MAMLRNRLCPQWTLLSRPAHALTLELEGGVWEALRLAVSGRRAFAQLKSAEMRSQKPFER
ncbi:exported protein of unknown function (plasmid) [Cupriavidus taiwanensis]|uniref:Uncharacterized protein n=1 Tax=Cupriavidus taiwanensis TaxID=164546 RepID=A0A375EEA1_9BURK|nr:exported protein of unknown function [Cupriavidus taiwanensis]SPA11297.1 exported protein of unknown function [Cupriavidus taiwanensis]SPA57264.1 exported protein of unknown function [Cupriavidus taiwanensis]SPD48882.1 protein of unknown function [Cupriavidus taiwanensis]